MLHLGRSRAVAVILGVGLFVADAALPLRAQNLPEASGTDLTLPPDLRPGAQAPSNDRVPKSKSIHHHPDRRHTAAAPVASVGTAAASRRASQSDDHPVDLGVTMRGGSGTARAYAPTGDSEVLQESGSAFGAGMRFGF